MTEKVTLGYWAIRGRGQVARLLLAYTGAVWEDKKYVSPESWGKDRGQLNLEFPNLPYLVEGDYKLTESEAIYNYIIQRSGKPQLLGNNAKQAGRIQMIRGVFGDIFQEFMKLSFQTKQWELQAPKSHEKLKNKFQYLAHFVGEKEFIFGHLTVVDFILSQLSYFLEKIFPEEFKLHGFWKRIRDNVNNLPEIKKYYEQQSSLKGPFLPPFASLQI